MSDRETEAGVDSRSLSYRLGRWWRLNPRVRWVAVGAVGAVVLILAATLATPGESNKPSDTIAMPTASSDLKGENYKDVVTKLKTAGFTSVETTAMDDLVLGWLAKDGEVERVSVNGDTEFEADSKFPKGAKIVVTYHTFPKEEPKKAAESDADESETPKSIPAENEAPESGTQEANDTILTPQNSEELKAVLAADSAGEPAVRAFIEKYAGRIIEFDGYTWDWTNDSSTSRASDADGTLYATNIYVGDVANANVSGGPTFRVEDFQALDGWVPPVKKNVHVKARIYGYNEVHDRIEITLVSLITK